MNKRARQLHRKHSIAFKVRSGRIQRQLVRLDRLFTRISKDKKVVKL